MSHDTAHRPPTHRPAAAGARITVLGDDRVELRLADLATVESECIVACASGDRTTPVWTGVPVADLLAVADAQAETTHLRVGSDDGYAVCVEVRDALDALIALRRDEARLADAEA